jgi:hypothetical protein
VVVAALQGRVHAYEGWSADDVAFGARMLCGLGVKLLLVTNAAGGVNPAYAPGDLVRIADHINLSGQNPLVGENDDRVGPRFLDLTQAYDPLLASLLDACAHGRARGGDLRRHQPRRGAFAPSPLPRGGCRGGSPGAGPAGRAGDGLPAACQPALTPRHPPRQGGSRPDLPHWVSGSGPVV